MSIINSMVANVNSPFVHRGRDIAYTMWFVVFAMSPAVIVSTVVFGFGVLIQLIVAMITAVAAECFANFLRRDRLSDGITDGTAIVLGIIVALAIPSYVDWILCVSAVLLASLIGKHAFGGTGHNIFNPAMVGYLIILVCFPRAMSEWPRPYGGEFVGPLEAIRYIFTDAVISERFSATLERTYDGISGATVLDFSKTALHLSLTQSEFEHHEMFGLFAGRGTEYVSLAFLCGGLALCWRGIISLKVPLMVCVGVALCASVFYFIDSDRFQDPLFHLFAGSTMMAAFFIATDPVTSPSTPLGLAVFGFAAGALIYLLRVFGPFPDSVVFAIIIMNALTPLIDRLTGPRIYGA